MCSGWYMPVPMRAPLGRSPVLMLMHHSLTCTCSCWARARAYAAHAGTAGQAFTFFTATNAKSTGKELLRILTENGQEVPPEFSALVQAFGGGGGGGNRRWGGGGGRGGGGGSGSFTGGNATPLGGIRRF